MQNNCDKVSETYDKVLFYDSAKVWTLWLCNIQSISTEEVHKNLFYKMIDDGSLHHSLPFYSVSNIFHRVVKSVDNDLRSVTNHIYEK